MHRGAPNMRNLLIHSLDCFFVPRPQDAEQLVLLVHSAQSVTNN